MNGKPKQSCLITMPGELPPSSLDTWDDVVAGESNVSIALGFSPRKLL
jgi:hypothetical protein